MFFKGYVPTRNKKCLMSFKDKGTDKLLTLSEVQNFDEYAGVLADDVILIDIDDLEQSEILLHIVQERKIKCRVYKTSRGKHFLFYNSLVEKCSTGTSLACGLKADIKLGSRNSYSVLKFNGQEREILYNAKDYDKLPPFLLPVKNTPDFLTMSDGDGRNQTFFNYILTLQNEGLDKEQIRETITIINDYVLKSPLPKRELETILRDEAFEKPSFYQDKTFLFEKFARYLIANYHIIKINGQLHIYSDGIYVSGLQRIEAIMIQIIPRLKRAWRSEVIDYLNLIAQEANYSDMANLIAFQNGVYDLSIDQLLDFSPSYYITNKIPWNYTRNTRSELLENTLNKIACNDPQIRALLDEVAGYCFYRRNELRKSFILIGEKANGKSTYLDLLNHMLGNQNVSNLDLKDLGDRFSPASLFGVLANIGDDIGDDFVGGATAAQFKKIVSGSRIRGERKGQDEFFFDPYCKMIYSANNIPRIKDKSGAVLDRMVIIPFNARFSPDDPDFDPYIKYKLRSSECMEALIQLGLTGLRNVLQRQSFTISEKVTKQLTEYAENNQPILLFFKEITRDEIVNNPTRDIYKKYNEFCLFNNFTPMSNIEFSKQLKKKFKLKIIDKKINGTKYRIFTEV